MFFLKSLYNGNIEIEQNFQKCEYDYGYNYLIFFVGYEVVYVEVECLLEFLSVKYLIIKGYEFLEVFMFYFNKGYNCIKIRQ